MQASSLDAIQLMVLWAESSATLLQRGKRTNACTLRSKKMAVMLEELIELHHLRLNRQSRCSTTELLGSIGTFGKRATAT